MLKITSDISSMSAFIKKAKCCTAVAASEFVSSSQSGKGSQLTKIKKVRNNVYRIYALEKGYDFSGDECLEEIEAIRMGNLIDCGCCDEDVTSAEFCSLENLGAGFCWAAVSQTLRLVVADGSTSNNEYENYYYEYYLSGSQNGPWTLGSTSNSNTAIITNLDLDFNHCRIIAKCNKESNYFVEFIGAFKIISGNGLSLESFGYYTYPGQVVPVSINNEWVVRESDIVNVINLNDDFTISLIENKTTGLPLGAGSNNIPIDVDYGIPQQISDQDVIWIYFSYTVNPSSLPCPIIRVLSARVVPNPVIVSDEGTPGLVCPIDNGVNLSVSNYAYDSFLWSTGQTTSSITVTSPGTYSCTCTFRGVPVSSSITFSAGATPPTPILINDSTGLEIDTPIILCFPPTINIRVIDTGIYSGGWPVGTTFEWNFLGTPLPSLDIVSPVYGSTYNCIVRVPGACPVQTDTSTVITTAITVNPLLKNPSACSPFSGFIDALITPSPPSPPYRFLWTSDLAQTIVLRDITTASTTDTLSSLSAGSYYLQITDANSCQSSIFSYPLALPAPIVLTMSKTDISCNGFADGSASVSVTGGAPPYTYLWNDAFTTASRQVFTGGLYSVTVTDTDGCTATNSVTVIEPAVLLVTITNPAGFNLSASGSGGTPPYTYDWFDGSFNPIGSGANITVGGPGTYYCSVTDSNSCNFANSITI